jgi:hypothetical protein
MQELGLDITSVLAWFAHEREIPYVLVRVSDGCAQAWANALGVVVRRCYVSDTLLQERAATLGRSKPEILSALLPDPGATMAGDFGEILVFLYQAAQGHPAVAFGPKKWRLKQDRTKPAPHSDVVQFVLPSWPIPSKDDLLFCAEVKAKSTDAGSSPIKAAIEGCAKDRTSRLARTLVWLRERTLTADLGSVKIEHLDRFINATDHPPCTKRFQAVAVVCASLVEGELADAPMTQPDDYTVVVISVPDLRKTYMAVFDAAHRSIRDSSATDAPAPRSE